MTQHKPGDIGRPVYRSIDGSETRRYPYQQPGSSQVFIFKEPRVFEPTKADKGTAESPLKKKSPKTQSCE